MQNVYRKTIRRGKMKKRDTLDENNSPGLSKGEV